MLHRIVFEHLDQKAQVESIYLVEGMINVNKMGELSSCGTKTPESLVALILIILNAYSEVV